MYELTVEQERDVLKKKADKFAEWMLIYYERWICEKEKNIELVKENECKNSEVFK